ncbi:MAG: 2-oxoacid ferredoxin oxidoreductase [Deltaproteobacteria bacterium]|nr:2-oxoacid ferredoxin oxidoreductase [Deltaproteobacteria bacterium]MBN2687664.1 2-oxoacid ferredoxin oxidoreductase [Deltaproteobacteria bacterium]
MKQGPFDRGAIDIAWCPGCGNFAILNALKAALTQLGISPEQIVIASGIGQAAKMPHYVRTNVFNGLHGRAIPAATAIKAANPGLTVIAEGGDGDMYGEGGNHFIHAIRRNPDITAIIHNNMVYGLTKGQASPTSSLGFKTPVQVGGVTEEPFNAMAVAIALNASFVARAFAGDVDQTRDIIKAAISHRGFSIVEILQPCVSFNKVNTFQWFKENSGYVEDSYDPSDRSAAFNRAAEGGKMALGICYVNSERSCFEETLSPYSEDSTPLFKRDVDMAKLARLVDSKRQA